MLLAAVRQWPTLSQCKDSLSRNQPPGFLEETSDYKDSFSIVKFSAILSDTIIASNPCIFVLWFCVNNVIRVILHLMFLTYLLSHRYHKHFAPSQFFIKCVTPLENSQIPMYILKLMTMHRIKSLEWLGESNNTKTIY